MTEVAVIISEILERGQACTDDSTVLIPDLQPGQFAAQGDLNFIALAELPEGAVEVVTVPQLAPGNSRGSRHCIKEEDLHKVRSFRLPDPTPLQGPILYFEEPITIEHPEHRHQFWNTGCKPCLIAVTYQRKHAEEVRRIQD